MDHNFKATLLTMTLLVPLVGLAVGAPPASAHWCYANTIWYAEAQTACGSCGPSGYHEHWMNGNNGWIYYCSSSKAAEDTGMAIEEGY